MTPEEREQFYNLCQVYRHWSMVDQEGVCHQYEALIEWVDNRQRQALAEQRRESAILARDFILKRCGCNKGVGHACGDGAPCNCPHHDIDIAICKETP
jgi:hypothetical protein